LPTIPLHRESGTCALQECRQTVPHVLAHVRAALASGSQERIRLVDKQNRALPARLGPIKKLRGESTMDPGTSFPNPIARHMTNNDQRLAQPSPHVAIAVIKGPG
jgi:hypothetical protein